MSSPLTFTSASPIWGLTASAARRAGCGAQRGLARPCAASPGAAAFGALFTSGKTARNPAQRRDAAPVGEQAQRQQYQPERHDGAGKVLPFRKFTDHDDEAGHQPEAEDQQRGLRIAQSPRRRSRRPLASRPHRPPFHATTANRRKRAGGPRSVLLTYSAAGALAKRG